MAKKLIFVWLSITIIACSSISIYATTKSNENEETVNTINTSADNSEVASRTIKNLTAITNAGKEEAAEKIAAEKEAAEKEAAAAEAQNSIQGIASYIVSKNSNVSSTEAAQMANYFVNAANTYGVDVYYLVAIAKHESCFYANVTSSAGCKGLMQTSDTLANKYGYSGNDAYNAQTAIVIGAQYLKSCLDTFGGDYMLALSGYAYGCGAVKSGNFNYGYANDFTQIRSEIMAYI